MRKPVFGFFPTRSDTNRAVQPQKVATARGSKFWRDCVAKTNALISTTDLRLCFRIYAKSWSSHDAAQLSAGYTLDISA